MTRARVARCVLINSPSILLLLWGALIALDQMNSRPVRVVFFLGLAFAFFVEERVKWTERRRRT